MTYVDPRTYRPDEILSAADVNAMIAGTLTRLDNRPAAKVFNADSEGQDVGSGNWEAIAASAAKFNRDLWDGGNALVLPEEGLYLFGMNWALFTDTNGIRLGRVLENGRHQVVRSGPWVPSGIRFRGNCFGAFYGFPGDAFEGQIMQTSGTQLAVLNEENYGSYFYGVQLTAGRDVETWTAPITWGASDVPTAAQLIEQIEQNVRFLRSQPAGLIRRLSNTPQTTTSGTFLALEHDMPQIDSTATKMYSDANKTRLTIRRTGVYLVGGSFHLDANATGQRGGRIRVNGATELDAKYEGIPGNAGHGTRPNLITLVSLSSGDYLELEAFQNSGGNINATPHPQHAPVLWAALLSETTAPPSGPTAQRVWIPGETITASDLNTYLRDWMLFLLRQPCVKATKNANQSVNNDTWTAVTFPTESFDNDTMHSTVSNTSRITFTRAGLYVVGAGVRFATSGTGSRREVRIVVNGPGSPGTEGAIAYDHQVPGNGSINVFVNVPTLHRFNAGDFAEVYVRQNSGGALNVLSSQTAFWACRLSA